MSHKIKPEEWEDWKQSPITQAFLEGLRKSAKLKFHQWAMEQWGTEEASQRALDHMRAIQRSINDIRETELEHIERIEEEYAEYQRSQNL